uniref:Arf-GAP domain-containing protein n=1 Tax=Macrostomum lignano TaxID=282301 RepID=A0A1I8JQG3_9PLAT
STSTGWPRGLERCHRLHQAEALRPLRYEIYSTFLHEESPLSLLASNSTTSDASRQQLHDEAVHPLERPLRHRRLHRSRPGVDCPSGAAANKPRAQALMAPRWRAWQPARWPTCSKNDATAFCRTCCAALPGGSTPEQRHAGRDCWPRLRMLRNRSLRQLPLRPPAWPPAAAGARPRSGTGRVAGAGRVADVVRLASTEASARQKSLLSRMGRAAASAASASSGSGAAPDERLRVGAHALEPCALTKAQVCAACDQVLYGAAPQGAAMHSRLRAGVHRSCAQQAQLRPALCTKRGPRPGLRTPALASLKKFRRQQQTGGDCAHQRHPSSQASVDASAMPRQRFGRWRIDEVEDWMLSGRQVQRNNPDC